MGDKTVAREAAGEARVTADAELARIRDEHETWLETDEAEGRRAELVDARLPKADLSGAVLCKADLSHAVLSEANLSQAQLTGAVLVRADLRDADLERATLDGADLRDCKLEGANLRDVDLRGVQGLSATQFARTDLTGARLPEALGGFEKKLEHLAEMSRIARPLFLSVLVSSIFAFLTVLSTSDAALLTNQSSAVLPNLPTRIPAASLFWVGPLALVFLYGYLHFYLADIWVALAELPAVFPDGSPLAKRAHPWLLISPVRRGCAPTQERESLLDRLRNVIVVLLVWWTVPITLLAFWWTYLPRHHWVTGLHVALIFLSATLAVALYRQAARVLRLRPLGLPRLLPTREPRSPSRLISGPPSGLRDPALAWGVAGVALLGLTSFLVIHHPMLFAFLHKTPRPKHVRWLVADVDGKNLSTRPLGWDGEDLARIKGVNLRGANLSNASGHRAFLVNADLRGSDFEGADFQRGDFRQALLEDATLEAAKLDQADFERACLRKTVLRCADLNAATFSSAYLGRADLQGACLMQANFDDAHLPGSDLRGANLEQARLERARLLCFVSGKMDPSPKIECANLEGANLGKASLRAADLRYANLTSADLEETDLREADLCGATLEGANLENAALDGANLRDADLNGVVGLTQEQLAGACGPAKNLPAGLELAACTESSEAKPCSTPRGASVAEPEPHPCLHQVLGDPWPQPERPLKKKSQGPLPVRVSDLDPGECRWRQMCF